MHAYKNSDSSSSRSISSSREHKSSLNQEGRPGKRKQGGGGDGGGQGEGGEGLKLQTQIEKLCDSVAMSAEQYVLPPPPHKSLPVQKYLQMCQHPLLPYAK